MTARRTQSLASLAVVIAGALWGLFWIPARSFGEAGVNGAWTAAIFFAVATLALLPLLPMRTRQLAAMRPGHLVTGCFMSLAFSLYSVSLLLTTVINAMLLFYLTPVWSTILGRLLLGEQVTAWRLLAVGLGILGVVVILDPTMGLPLPRNLGDWLSLIAGAAWSYGSLRSYAQPQLGITESVLAFCLTGVFTATMLAALIPASAIGPMPGVPVLMVVLPSILAIGLILFVPSNFLLIWGTQVLSPTRVGILLMSELVAGAISAALWAGEPFGLLQLAGTALIIAAGAVEVLGRSHPSAAATR
jgi:drug/metabolite transporter (DMT)-like permease